MDGSPLLGSTRLPEPCAIVILGGTGDLASRKLLPALWGLWQNGYLPAEFVILGVSRRIGGDEAYRQDVSRWLADSHGVKPDEALAKFLSHVHSQATDFTAADQVDRLAQRLGELERVQGLGGNRLFYLAIDPDHFQTVIEQLSRVKIVERDRTQPWVRMVFEKPFGSDLKSAIALDVRLLQHLREDQIYRIDHYLGKETVQNLLAFRFGNAIFEPLFHRNYVEHVQITVAEKVGMEGRRGSFYDGAGAMRDVVQNHVLQVLALVTMEPPSTLRAADVAAAKLKVLRELMPITDSAIARHVVRGQYSAGTIDGKPMPAYRAEVGVAPNSTTESYVALRTTIDNWRWAGVPILLRTGKRMPRRVTEIAVHFKLPPRHLFRTVECEGDFCDLTEAQPNVLAFRIQPDEGIHLTFSVKRPGMQLDLQSVNLNFDYDDAFSKRLPEAYERLLFDALRGDATLFMRSDELEAAWSFVTPILEYWQSHPPVEFPNYQAGTWGPAEAEQLMLRCACGWREP